MKRKRSRGFTLLDMVIAIALVLLLSVLGITGYRRYQWSINLREGTNMLAEDLKYTQQMSIQNPYPSRDGKTVLYCIVVRDGFYDIAVYDLGQTGGEPKQLVKTVKLPPNINIICSSDVIFGQAGTLINDSGMAEGNITIQVTEQNLNKTKEIQITSVGAVIKDN